MPLPRSLAPSTLLLALALVFALSIHTAHALDPWRNKSLPISTRVADLLSRLTVDEKISQMMSNTAAVPRLGIPAFEWGNECLHGVKADGNLTATVFPQPIGLAAAFNTSLLQSIGTAIGDEARALYNAGNNGYLMFFAPNMNIYRDPRWGRGSETYGEDPFLSATLTQTFVTALQGTGDGLKVGATCKHFAGYSLEEYDGISRFEFNAEISIRDLRETYLPAFRACVVGARVASVMCSYNSINGVPSCGNPYLLQDILREDMDFHGFVVSDCGAVGNMATESHYVASVTEAAAVGLRAGTDVDCGDAYTKLPDALAQGLVTTADIDTGLGRALTARFRLGVYDTPGDGLYDDIKQTATQNAAHEALALDAARQAIVLLKNNAGTLPLKAADIKKIALIGPQADDGLVLLGNYHGNPTHPPVTPAAALTAMLGADRVVVSQGAWVVGEGTWKFGDAVAAAAQADVAVVFVGSSSKGTNLSQPNLLSPATEKESLDRRDLLLPGVQEDLVKAIAKRTQTRLVVVLVQGGGIDVQWLQESDRVGAILNAWYPGQEGGTAIAEVLLGLTNPSGRLPISIHYNNYTSLIEPSVMDMVPYPGRTYRYVQVPVLYPFGYGLSYTRFGLDSLRITPAGGSAGVPRRLSVRVTNQGDMDGAHTVLVYASYLNGTLPGSYHAPTKSLVAFQKTAIRAGASATLSIPLLSSTWTLVLDDGEQATPTACWRVCCDDASVCQDLCISAA